MCQTCSAETFHGSHFFTLNEEWSQKACELRWTTTPFCQFLALCTNHAGGVIFPQFRPHWRWGRHQSNSEGPNLSGFEKPSNQMANCPGIKLIKSLPWCVLMPSKNKPIKTPSPAESCLLELGFRAGDQVNKPGARLRDLDAACGHLWTSCSSVHCYATNSHEFGKCLTSHRHILSWPLVMEPVDNWRWSWSPLADEIELHNLAQWNLRYGYVMQLSCSVCTTCSSVFCCFQILLSSTLVVKQEQLCLARSCCSGSNLPPSCWHFKQPQTPKKLKKHFGLMGLIWLTVSWIWFVSTWVIPKLVLCHHHRK